TRWRSASVSSSSVHPAERHPEVDGELRLATGGGIRDHGDEDPGLEVQPWPRPDGAKDRLRRDVDELAHHRVAVRRGVDPLHVRLSKKFAAQLSALPVGLALGHQRLLIVAWITAAAQQFRAMSRSVPPDEPCRNDRASSSTRHEGALAKQPESGCPPVSLMSRSCC